MSQRRGPPTQFRSWHLLSAFYIFCKAEHPVGRYQLGEELELGDGSIRSLVRFLRSRGLIEPRGRQGHQLSEQGSQYCRELNEVLLDLVEVPASSFTVDKENFACHLRNRAQYLTDGLVQRDAAKQAGATGATTFFQGTNLDVITMPLEHEFPKTELKTILPAFNLQLGDVIIIGSAHTRLTAQLGALAAALTLLQKKVKRVF
ncbi:MAG: hypothetical protein Q6364_11605 [Candidatus Hermodarchaeota archaeon]|nr:hypothetical protein [Candidatus Hermodarchaeota archaeon]